MEATAMSTHGGTAPLSNCLFDKARDFFFFNVRNILKRVSDSLMMHEDRGWGRWGGLV